MSNTDYFSTQDLNLSAVLVSQGQVLDKTEKNSDNKFLFYFLKTEKLECLIDQYWKQKLKVKPQDLFSSLKSIKNRIYSEY